jgi:hypothetical protein
VYGANCVEPSLAYLASRTSKGDTVNKKRLAFVVGIILGFAFSYGVLAPSASADEGSASATCDFQRWWVAETCGDHEWRFTIHQECLQALKYNPDFVSHDQVCKKDLGIHNTKPKVLPTPQATPTKPATKAKPKAVVKTNVQHRATVTTSVSTVHKVLTSRRPQPSGKPSNQVQSPVKGAYLTYKVATGRWLLNH